MIARLIAWLRAASIERIEQDIAWANASHDDHVAGLEARLEELRAADRRSAHDVAREVSRGAKGLA